MDKLTRLQNHSCSMFTFYSVVTITFMTGTLFCGPDTIGGQILPTLSLLGILGTAIHADYYMIFSNNE